MTPPDDLRLASATALAAAIARKELRAVEVVDAHIAHARAVNPTLNAIVVERFAAARAEAEAADAHQEAGHPLQARRNVPRRPRVVGVPRPELPCGRWQRA